MPIIVFALVVISATMITASDANVAVFPTLETPTGREEFRLESGLGERQFGAFVSVQASAAACQIVLRSSGETNSEELVIFLRELETGSTLIHTTGPVLRGHAAQTKVPTEQSGWDFQRSIVIPGGETRSYIFVATELGHKGAGINIECAGSAIISGHEAMRGMLFSLASDGHGVGLTASGLHSSSVALQTIDLNLPTSDGWFYVENRASSVNEISVESKSLNATFSLQEEDWSLHRIDEGPARLHVQYVGSGVQTLYAVVLSFNGPVSGTLWDGCKNC